MQRLVNFYRKWARRQGSAQDFSGDDSYRQVCQAYEEGRFIMVASVIYGIHDIFVPYDYPQEWLSRFYNEQYLLMAYLLGGHNNDHIVFPGNYAWQNQEYSQAISDIFTPPALHEVERHAGAFWIRRSS